MSSRETIPSRVLTESAMGGLRKNIDKTFFPLFVVTKGSLKGPLQHFFVTRESSSMIEDQHWRFDPSHVICFFACLSFDLSPSLNSTFDVCSLITSCDGSLSMVYSRREMWNTKTLLLERQPFNPFLHLECLNSG